MKTASWPLLLLLCVLMVLSMAACDTLIQPATVDVRQEDCIIYFNPDLETDYQFTYDVVVVGAGLAGLSAATTVAEEGHSVVLLEKMPAIGGNSIRSSGTLNAVDPIRQSAQGIEDSVELFIKNTYESGGQLGNPDLITLLCENAWDARNWIEAHGGAWKENGVYLSSGGVWPRSLGPAVSANETFVRPLAQAIVQNGGDIIIDMKAELLLQNVDGRVSGVSAESIQSGRKFAFYGTHGVILATGGFGANAQMIAQYQTGIPQGVTSETTPAATGDGILMAQAVGAEVIQMQHIQMQPGVRDRGLYFSSEMGNCIYVNTLGKRFVSEQASGNELCRAILEQPDQLGYVIFDRNTIGPDFVDNAGRNVEDLKRSAKLGYGGYGESLEELARQIGIDPVSLTKTVEEFNLIVDGKAPDPFGRELFYKKLGDGPFFSSKRTAMIHHAMGGLKIDTRAHVIGRNGQHILGLYACGELTGGIHGNSLINGNALTDCVVFGRIAGRNVVDGI